MVATCTAKVQVQTFNCWFSVLVLLPRNNPPLFYWVLRISIISSLVLSNSCYISEIQALFIFLSYTKSLMILGFPELLQLLTNMYIFKIWCNESPTKWKTYIVMIFFRNNLKKADFHSKIRADSGWTSIDDEKLLAMWVIQHLKKNFEKTIGLNIQTS